MNTRGKGVGQRASEVVHGRSHICFDRGCDFSTGDLQPNSSPPKYCGPPPYIMSRAVDDKVPMILFAGNSHPVLANLIAE